MIYRRFKIKENERIADNLYNMVLQGDYPSFMPGQFFMLWIPGIEEVPMAPSVKDGDLRITYKVVGETTEYMSRMDSGEDVYLRGPLGRGFEIDKEGRYLLIAGGVGAAPIIYAAYLLSMNGYRFTYVEGVKTSKYKLFIDEASRYGGEAILYTEDGSEGFRGYPTEYLMEYGSRYDYVLACGPEEMNRRVVEICNELRIRCQVSMERIVKCGLGVCGSCVIESTGLLVCIDGPVFNVDELVSKGYI